MEVQATTENNMGFHKLKSSCPPSFGSNTLTDRSHLAQHFRDLGIARFMAGDSAEAYTQFRFGLNCLPNDAGLHALIANTALRLGAPHLAADHAATAVDLQPDNIDALVALAGARLQLKDPRARETVGLLSRFDQLGDFRQLLQIAASTGPGHEEAALVDLAQYLEKHPRDVFAGELFTETFGSFLNSGENERFQMFLDGVGILAEPADRIPLDRSDLECDACIDIIIPVYNSIGDLAACLDSIRKWHSAAIRQIILVDDCSTPESAAWLAGYRDNHSDVLLVRNAENLGFTRAIMAGVRESTAPHMLFLNSDTQVTSHWLHGMIQAMKAGPNTALVGPLSNNGYYQTIRPTHTNANPPIEQRSPDEIADLVRKTTRDIFPRVPLLSGFCLLVHRASFDLAGGLDCAAFPYGYWEVQDLCLKLIDLGLDSVIADNAYVHHSGAGSISEERRQDLVLQGLLRIYARHSSLRVLVAEAVSALEPEIKYHKKAWFAQDRIAERRRLQEDARPEHTVTARYQCYKRPPDDVMGQEVCLFVTHCPLGMPSEYTLRYLRELRQLGLVVIICLVMEDIGSPVADTILEIADGVLLRENAGHDFGAWSDLLRQFPQVWDARRLYFANDSLLGPFQSLAPTLDAIRIQDAGFFALTECTIKKRHAQSFFFGWNRANLSAAPLRDFWSQVANLHDKEEVIQQYEYPIAWISENLPDTTQHIVFGFDQVLGASASEVADISLPHDHWDKLLNAGFPFVKMNVLRDGFAKTSSALWETLCSRHGADVEALHRSIETSRLNGLVRRMRRNAPPL